MAKTKRIAISISDEKIKLIYELLKNKGMGIEAGLLLLAKDRKLRDSFFKDPKQVEYILNLDLEQTHLVDNKSTNMGSKKEVEIDVLNSKTEEQVINKTNNIETDTSDNIVESDRTTTFKNTVKL